MADDVKPVGTEISAEVLHLRKEISRLTELLSRRDQRISELTLNSDLTGIESVVLYFYNTDPDEILRNIFPTAHENYIKEKTRVYQSGFVNFWGVLDWDNRARFVHAARNKYSEEAARKLQKHVDMEGPIKLTVN